MLHEVIMWDNSKDDFISILDSSIKKVMEDAYRVYEATYENMMHEGILEGEREKIPFDTFQVDLINGLHHTLQAPHHHVEIVYTTHKIPTVERR